MILRVLSTLNDSLVLWFFNHCCQGVGGGLRKGENLGRV